MPWPLYPRYSLDKTPVEPQNWSGHCGVEKNLLPLPGIEPRLTRYHTAWAMPALHSPAFPKHYFIAIRTSSLPKPRKEMVLTVLAPSLVPKMDVGGSKMRAVRTVLNHGSANCLVTQHIYKWQMFTSVTAMRSTLFLVPSRKNSWHWLHEKSHVCWFLSIIDLTTLV
jgi:hypothetical protein